MFLLEDLKSDVKNQYDNIKNDLNLQEIKLASLIDENLILNRYKNVDDIRCKKIELINKIDHVFDSNIKELEFYFNESNLIEIEDKEVIRKRALKTFLIYFKNEELKTEIVDKFDMTGLGILILSNCYLDKSMLNNIISKDKCHEFIKYDQVNLNVIIYL